MYGLNIVGTCKNRKKSLYCNRDNPLSQIDKLNYRCTPNIYFMEKKTQLPKLVQLNAILLLGALVGFFALAGLVQQFIYQRIILALMNMNCMKVWKLRFQLHASFFFQQPG